jgi:NlpC/P60 family
LGHKTISKSEPLCGSLFAISQNNGILHSDRSFTDLVQIFHLWKESTMTSELQHGEGQRLTVRKALAPLRSLTRNCIETHALLNEEVLVTEVCREPGTLRVKLISGAERLLVNGESQFNYEGFMSATDFSMGPPDEQPHWVCVPSTHALEDSQTRALTVMTLFMNTHVTPTRKQGDRMYLDSIGWVHESTVKPLEDRPKDFVSVAEMFLGCPYLWGGITSQGIDCSALLFTALQACGIYAPRDAGPQSRVLGESKDFGEWDQYYRGDLVFWKGHVGIMVNGHEIIHATDYFMSVVKEPLARVIERKSNQGSEITAVRTFPYYAF